MRNHITSKGSIALRAGRALVVRHSMRIKHILFVFLVFRSLEANFAYAQDEPVHFIKTHQTEFVSGGGIETITLEVSAKSFASPFSWSVTVKNESGVLFFAERNDAWLDGFFNDSGYVTDCGNYTDCKKKWYFNDLVKSIIEAPQIFPPRQTSPESWEIEAIESLGTEYLRQKKVTPQKIDSAISEMKSSILKGYSMFVVPVSPVETDSSFMYVQSLNYFVPYWND